MIKRFTYSCILALLFVGSVGYGQDIHFSQFMQSPMNLNPALVGCFDCEYRVIANHRHQWRSVTVPYVTYGVSADARNFNKIDGLNTGISFYYDKAGDSRFTTLKVNLVGGYRYVIDSVSSIAGGLSFGLTQRTIDYSDLQFDSQYNGFNYDSSLDNGESFARDSRLYLNLNLGAKYLWEKSARKRFRVGVSGFNLNTPKQSFFDDENIKLDRRYNFHADAQFAVAAKFDILPALMYSSQGTFKEFMIGGSAKYIMINENGIYRAFRAGLYARAKDAGFISGGMDYDNWYFGISYDINYSNLTPASNYRGALELSVIWKYCTFKPKKVKHIICPNYI